MEDTRYKVLLIEDDELDQKSFERLVEEEQLCYDYTIAGSVSESRNILAYKLFDVVIADYSLGDGTAFDVLGLVKDTPLIIVTGAGDEEVAVKALRAGAHDYMVKDMERNYLKAVPVTIEKVVKHKRLVELVKLD